MAGWVNEREKKWNETSARDRDRARREKRERDRDRDEVVFEKVNGKRAWFKLSAFRSLLLAVAIVIPFGGHPLWSSSCCQQRTKICQYIKSDTYTLHTRVSYPMWRNRLLYCLTSPFWLHLFAYIPIQHPAHVSLLREHYANTFFCRRRSLCTLAFVTFFILYFDSSAGCS